MSELLKSFFGLSSAIAEEGVKRYHDYSVEELTELTFIQRVLLYDWKIEAFTLLFTLGFVFLFKYGDSYNNKLVNKWLAKHEKVFQSQFFQYGVNSKDLYVKDDSENFSAYATGRSNISKVNIQFKLKPRHNSFVFFLEYLISFFTAVVRAPTDRIGIVITPSNGDKYDNFIFAVVNKDGMSDYRNDHYYLSLTRTSDSPKLPKEFVFMSEAAEITETIFDEELSQAIPNTQNFLKFIAVTDQQQERPKTINDLIPRKRIILSLKFPSNEQEFEQSTKLINAAINLVDSLGSKGKFRPEVNKRIFKTRETEIKKINKIEEDIKNEELTEKKLKEKKEQREKLNKMSREEQVKFEKKQKDKQQRKLKNKQKVRA